MHAQAHTHEASSAMAEAMAARNLQFLALIENTIDRVSSDTDHVRACSKAIDEVMKGLQNSYAELPFEEVRLVELMERTQDMVRRIRMDAKKHHDSACNNKMLKPEDGVVDAYADFIEAIEELFNCASEFKDWIETHNALLEESTGTSYDTAEGLIAALQAD